MINNNNMSEYPCVSILTPTYNRGDFTELCILNLKNQLYPLDKLEWFVLDDSKVAYTNDKIEYIKKSIAPIKFKYIYSPIKATIGAKRNKLVKLCTYKTCIMMDDDDIYQKTYVKKSIETKEAHYWSRSRKSLWHKGKTSGFVQKIKDIRIDDDQDAVWLKVDIGNGASCHVGYKSCFYRSVSLGKANKIKLKFKEKKKKFDPNKVYKDQPNPTKL